MRPVLLLFGPALIAGLVLTALTVRARESDDAFALEQRRLSGLSAQTLEAAVASAPEPRLDDRGRPATEVRCTPGGTTTALRNPWTCRASYRSGRTVRYRVVVDQTGRWRGTSPDGIRQVYGRLDLSGG